MAIYGKNLSKEPEVLVTFGNDDVLDCISICRDGSVKVKEGVALDEASQEFWNGVQDYLPVKESEIIETKYQLVMAHYLIQKLTKLKPDLFEKVGAEDQRFFLNTINGLSDYFNHRRR